jgi:hypothetical protein
LLSATFFSETDVFLFLYAVNIRNHYQIPPHHIATPPNKKKLQIYMKQLRLVGNAATPKMAVSRVKNSRDR